MFVSSEKVSDGPKPMPKRRSQREAMPNGEPSARPRELIGMCKSTKSQGSRAKSQLTDVARIRGRAEGVVHAHVVAQVEICTDLSEPFTETTSLGRKMPGEEAPSHPRIVVWYVSMFSAKMRIQAMSGCVESMSIPLRFRPLLNNVHISEITWTTGPQTQTRRKPLTVTVTVTVTILPFFRPHVTIPH